MTVSGSGDGGWRNAASIVEGSPSVEAQAQQRRSRRRRVALFMVVLALPFLTFGVLAATGIRLPEPAAAEPSAILRALGLVLAVVGLILVVAGMVRLVRTGIWGQAWRAPTQSLDRRERRQLVRRVLRGEAVPDEQYLVAADLARRIVGHGPALLIIVGVGCSSFGQALTNSSSVIRWAFVIL